MKPDPVRWRDGAPDAPPDARAWIAGLRAPGPMPRATRARAAAVASRVAGTKAGAAWLSAKALVAVGTLAVAALSARVVLVAPRRTAAVAPRAVATLPRAAAIVAPARTLAPATPQRPTAVALRPASPPPAVPHRAHIAAAPAAPVTAPIAQAPRAASDTPPVAAAPEESALAREVRQVDALRALVASDPGAALAAADAMAREFPDGTTAPDREFYAFEALRRLGRRDDARARGERLVARFAGTPGAARVARALARDQ